MFLLILCQDDGSDSIIHKNIIDFSKNSNLRFSVMPILLGIRHNISVGANQKNFAQCRNAILAVSKLFITPKE